MEVQQALPSLPSLLSSINVKTELRGFGGPSSSSSQSFSPGSSKSSSSHFDSKTLPLNDKGIGFGMPGQSQPASLNVQGALNHTSIQDLAPASHASSSRASEAKPVASQSKGKPSLMVDVKSAPSSPTKNGSSLNHWYGTRQQHGGSAKTSPPSRTSSSETATTTPKSAESSVDPSEAVNEDGTSPVYTGVSRSGLNGRWRAQLSTRGKTVHLGTFASAEEAARAWDRAAIAERGTAAITNFNIKDYLQEDGTLKPELTKPAGRKGDESGASGHKEYRGVYHSGTYGRWKARIVMNGQKIHLGTFSTAEEAARAWDRKAIEYRGFGTVTNFDASDYVGLANLHPGSSKGSPVEAENSDSDAASGAATARSDHRSDSESEDGASNRPWSPPLIEKGAKVSSSKEAGVKRRISEIMLASSSFQEDIRSPKLAAIELNTRPAAYEPQHSAPEADAPLTIGAGLLSLCAAAGV